MIGINMETIEPSSELALAFLAVVEAGSITAAATAMHSSKSQISKQLSRLERELGVQLLYRSTRRLALTEAGARYLEYCRQLRELLRQSTAAMRELREEASGRVRMTVPAMFGGAFMAELLLAFHQQYPAVRLELDISPALLDLEADGYDLAIRSAPQLAPPLVARCLFHTRDWIVAADSLLQRHGAPQRPADLAALPCVIHAGQRAGAHWLFTQGGKVEEVAAQHWLQISDYSLNERLAEAGAGFARLPDFVAAGAVSAGRLRRVLADYDTPGAAVYLVYPNKKPQPAKVRVLIDFIVDCFSGRDV